MRGDQVILFCDLKNTNSESDETNHFSNANRITHRQENNLEAADAKLITENIWLRRIIGILVLAIVIIVLAIWIGPATNWKIPTEP